MCGVPKRFKIESIKNSNIISLLLFGKQPISVHLEKGSIAIIKNLLPLSLTRSLFKFYLCFYYYPLVKWEISYTELSFIFEVKSITQVEQGLLPLSIGCNFGCSIN